MEIIIKKYDHYNRALECQINSKSHYRKVMQEKGFIEEEKAHRIADKAVAKNTKRYGISKKTEELIRAEKEQAKNGIVNMSDRLKDELKKCGVKFQNNRTDRELPKGYLKGGFYATD